MFLGEISMSIFEEKNKLHKSVTEPTHYTSEMAVVYKRTEQEIEFETKNTI